MSLCVRVGCVLCPTTSADVFRMKKWNPNKIHGKNRALSNRLPLQSQLSQGRIFSELFLGGYGCQRGTWGLLVKLERGKLKTPKYGNDLEERKSMP